MGIMQDDLCHPYMGIMQDDLCHPYMGIMQDDLCHPYNILSTTVLSDINRSKCSFGGKSINR